MYSPKIKERFIPILYRIGKERRIPMTRVVNEIVADYLTNHLANSLSQKKRSRKDKSKDG